MKNECQVKDYNSHDHRGMKILSVDENNVVKLQRADGTTIRILVPSQNYVSGRYTEYVPDIIYGLNFVTYGHYI